MVNRKRGKQKQGILACLLSIMLSPGPAGGAAAPPAPAPPAPPAPSGGGWWTSERKAIAKSLAITWGIILGVIGVLFLIGMYVSLVVAVILAGFIALIGLIHFIRKKKSGDGVNIYMGGEGKGWKQLVLVIIILVLLVITTIMFTFCEGITEGWLGTVCVPMSRAKIALFELVREAPEKLGTALEKQKALAVGDYYTGQVDENAEKQLGVYLENIKQADVKFYEDLPITMFATLKAQTLDETINITVGCNSSAATKAPQLFPQPPTFTVDVFEERDIDCTFLAGSLGKGVKRIEFTASFDFKTMAYTKSYFMDQDTLRSLRRENIDPLDQYGITDKTPGTTYTSGPIGIGMKLESQPMGIDRESDQRVTTIGITIDNRWEGKLMSIDEFDIIVPSGFEMTDLAGFSFSRIGCEDLREKASGCSDDLFNIYRVENPKMKAVPKGGFKTFRGHLRAQKSDFETLLGAAPVATHYFKVTLRYTYSLIQKKSIEITPSPTTGGGSAGGTGVDLQQPEVTMKPSDSTTTTITMEWETNEKTIDKLNYWETANPPPGGLSWRAPSSEADYSTSHKTTIIGLSPNKRYSFEIDSTDMAGNKKTTNPPSVVTKTS